MGHEAILGRSLTRLPRIVESLLVSIESATAPSEPLGVRTALGRAGPNPSEELVVLQHSVKRGQLGFHLQAQLRRHKKRFTGSYRSTILCRILRRIAGLGRNTNPNLRRLLRTRNQLYHP